MDVITVPEPFWKLDALLASREKEGHSFSISVSQDFLKVAAHADFSPSKLQEAARDRALNLGLALSASHQLLHLGEYGLHQIDWPYGGGTWLALEMSSVNKRRAIFSTHNCDKPNQQAFLLATWIEWAHYIEASTKEA